ETTTIGTSFTTFIATYLLEAARVGGLFVFPVWPIANIEPRRPMSAIGTKRTCRVAPHMSAFGGKGDMPFAPIRSYFVTMRRGGGDDFGSAGEIANVSHTFHPSGRCSAPNS